MSGLVSLSVVLSVVMAMAGSCLAATTYKLDPTTAYTQGCYEPCACPISISEGVGGTFGLEPIQLTGTYDTYAITDVDWEIPTFDGASWSVTGAGTYVVFSEVAVLHRLELDLVVGELPQMHFDSGWVLAEAPLPEFDIDVSVNGFNCYDWAFFIDAQPLPTDVTGDGVVDVEDLLAVVLAWGPCPAPNKCPADIDGDGIVTVADLVAVILSWSE